MRIRFSDAMKAIQYSNPVRSFILKKAGSVKVQTYSLYLIIRRRKKYEHVVYTTNCPS